MRGRQFSWLSRVRFSNALHESLKPSLFILRVLCHRTLTVGICSALAPHMGQAAATFGMGSGFTVAANWGTCTIEPKQSPQLLFHIG
jgi:hypothetical protein